MHLPKIDVQPRKLSELLYEMQTGKLQGEHQPLVDVIEDDEEIVAEG